MRTRIVLLLTAGLVLTCLAVVPAANTAPATKTARAYSSEMVDPSLFTSPSGSAEYKAAYEAGVAKFKKRQYAEAAADLQTAMQGAETGQEKSAAQLLMALSYHRVPDYDKAEGVLNEVLKQKDAAPSHRVEAQLNLGCVQCHTGPSEDILRPLPPEVIPSFEKVVAMPEANGAQKSKAQQLIGKCYRRTHQYAKAIPAYAKVLDIQGAAPGEVAESLRRTAECYIALGDCDKAVEAAGKLRTWPEASPADALQAEYYVAQVRVEQARQLLQKLLDSPGARPAEKNAAKALMERLVPPTTQPASANDSQGVVQNKTPDTPPDAALTEAQARIEQARQSLQKILDSPDARPAQKKAAKAMMGRLPLPTSQPASPGK